MFNFLIKLQSCTKLKVSQLVEEIFNLEILAFQFFSNIIHQENNESAGYFAQKVAFSFDTEDFHTY